MNLGKMIGENVKMLRSRQKISISELSRRSGISKAMLSDIEKGGSNPTINTIWKLADGLNVPYTSLLDEAKEPEDIVHKSDVGKTTEAGGRYRVYCYYPQNSLRDFEFYHCELDRNTQNTSAGHTRETWEYVYMEKGQLEIQTGRKSHVLHAGDAFYFDASREHTYINNTDEIAEFIVVNTL